MNYLKCNYFFLKHLAIAVLQNHIFTFYFILFHFFFTARLNLAGLQSYVRCRHKQKYITDKENKPLVDKECWSADYATQQLESGHGEDARVDREASAGEGEGS